MSNSLTVNNGWNIVMKPAARLVSEHWFSLTCTIEPVTSAISHKLLFYFSAAKNNQLL
ncbi:MAG: hypothetical protein ACI82I_001198 [Gammaproteobacteria bacterium]|jgi:hypothetical protein